MTAVLQLSATRRRRWARIAPYAGIGAFTILLLFPTTGMCRLYWGDLLYYFEPMYDFGRAALLRGALPLWNPDVLCGQPYVGNPQMSLLYPTTPLLCLLTAWNYILVVDLLHLFLCGAFTYRFLSRWTLHPFPAMCGALVFEGSGTVLGRLQFPPMIAAIAYIPLLLTFVDAVIDRPTATRMAGLSVAIGLILLAGHPQMAYFGLLLSTVYATARLIRAGTRGSPGLVRTLRARVLPLVACLFAGISLAAVQLIPMAQLVLESPREALTAQQANRFVLQPEHFATVVDPHFDGSPRDADFWPDGNAWEPALFLGWIPLLFAGYAVSRCARELCVRFWAIVALVGFWLALGNTAGLYWAAFKTVPGLANFHDPARFLILVAFGVSMLTAIGIDALRVRKRWCTHRVLAVVGFSIVAPIWYYAADWLPTARLTDIEHKPVGASMFRSDRTNSNELVGRIYQPEHQQYWRRYVTDGYSDYGPTDSRGLQAQIDSMLPNLNLQYGIPSASGYEPVPLNGPAGLDGLSRVALRRNEPNLLRLLEMMHVKYLVIPGYEHLSAAGIAPLQTGHTAFGALRIYMTESSMPAAWIVNDVRRVEGRMRIAAAISSPAFDPCETAVVTGGIWRGRAHEDTEEQAILHRKHGVVLLAHSAVLLRLRVDAGSDEGLLVCSFAAYPGWKATIDSTPARTYRADGALLGVAVPAGVHTVTVHYRPDVFQVGLFVSLLSLAAVVAAATYLATDHQASRHTSRGRHIEIASLDAAVAEIAPASRSESI